MVVSTMEALESHLWCKTGVGGMARYENDYDHQVRHDVKTVPGNPWFICTLWIADWHATRATSVEDLDKAMGLLEWVVDHALPSGVLAEQVHPDTGAPLSVSPLTWSHAAFIESVEHYLRRHAALTGITLVPATVTPEEGKTVAAS
jgi:GH15 family glucan-1,4-alpha-glucosidase